MTVHSVKSDLQSPNSTVMFGVTSSIWQREGRTKGRELELSRHRTEKLKIPEPARSMKHQGNGMQEPRIHISKQHTEQCMAQILRYVNF